MSGAYTKTCFDGSIRDLIGEGVTVRQMSSALGVSRDFVRARVRSLGLREVSARNGLAFQTAARGSVRRPKAGARGFVSATGKAIAQPGRVDHGAALLLQRVLCAPRDPALLTDNAIACLHEGGLTLSDLERAYGLPPAVAATAIRRAHGLHP